MTYIRVTIMFILILLPSLSYASKSTLYEVESEIITEVVERLGGGHLPKVFVAGFEDQVLKLLDEHFEIVDSCQEADLALLSSDLVDWEGCYGTPYLVKDITPYEIHDKNLLGAFYWKKGRPNIGLFCEAVEEHGFSVHNLSKYCE